MIFTYFKRLSGVLPRFGVLIVVNITKRTAKKTEKLTKHKKIQIYIEISEIICYNHVVK